MLGFQVMFQLPQHADFDSLAQKFASKATVFRDVHSRNGKAVAGNFKLAGPP